MRSPKLNKGRARRAGWIVGLLLGLAVALYLNRVRLLNQARFFNRRFLNPLMLRYAGREGAYDAIVQHVGRTSGKVYHTPVVATLIKDGFVIPLPYGTKVDWLRNIQAAGSASLHWNGRDYAIIEPIMIDATAARALLSPAKWWVYRVFGIVHFLRVTCTPETAIAAPEEAPAAEAALV